MLIRAVYEAAFEETESFELDSVGADLAYLMGTIAKAHPLGFAARRDSQLMDILEETFPDDHVVWTFIHMTDD